MSGLLIFFPHGDIDNRVRYCRGILNKLQIPPQEIKGVSIHRYSKLFHQKLTQRSYGCPDDQFWPCRDMIRKLIRATNPSVVIINDLVVYNNLFSHIYKSKSLETVRGSVFDHEDFPNVKFIIHDDYSKCYRRAYSDTDNPEIEAHVSLQDFKKTYRYYHNSPKAMDSFQSRYKLITTLDELHEFHNHISSAKLIATDVETSRLDITCVGFSFLHSDNTVWNYTVPILRGDTRFRNFWRTLDAEMRVWKIIKSILESGIPIVMHNGIYDLHYFIRYNVYPKNFILDTQLLMHSFSAEMKKSLAFTASLMCDNYYYWKDEISGTSADKDSPIKQRLPVSEIGTMNYYRYCARDCYYTLYSAIYLLPMLEQTPWIMDNYIRTLKLQHGPCFEMSLRGMRVNKKRKDRIERQLFLKSQLYLQKLKTAVADPDFNPNSPKQSSELFFDILKVPMVRKKRSTGEKYLKRVTIRNPIHFAMFRLFRDYKEPAKLASDIGGIKLFKDRLLYKINAAGTWTGRAASAEHHWWCGTNIQNKNKSLRPAFIADEGYVICSIDYSQSDGYFVAFESQDLNYIRVMSKNMNEGYDTHAFHVELILKTPYDEVIKGKKNKDPKIVHPITGQRSIIKRVVHGCNYIMGPDTMLTTVGNEALIAAANSQGLMKACFWPDEKLKSFTKQMQYIYFGYYKGVTKWQTEEANATIERGNIIQAYGGRTHLLFGNPLRDKSGRLLRKIAAFKGQGGTAGNINRSLLEIFYNSDLPAQGVQFLNQIHDEINFQVPINKLHLINNILTIMEKKITINSRTFFVPCEAEIGLSWQIYVAWDKSKTNYSDYKAEIELKERKYDEKLFGKNHKTPSKKMNPFSEMLLDSLHD